MFRKEIATLLFLAAVVVLVTVSQANPTILEKDWLIDPSGFEAKVVEDADQKTVTLTNGLVKRQFCLSGNAATVALENLMTGASELRSVRPEAMLEIDNVSLNVGGLEGQPIHNFLFEDWIQTLEPDLLSFQFVRFEKSKVLIVCRRKSAARAFNKTQI